MAEEPHSSLNSGRDTNRSLHIETLWSPWRITGLFLAVSLLWILGTDWLLLTLVDNDRLAREIQTW
jgi:hypothetical protein